MIIDHDYIYPKKVDTHCFVILLNVVKINDNIVITKRKFCQNWWKFGHTQGKCGHTQGRFGNTNRKFGNYHGLFLDALASLGSHMSVTDSLTHTFSCPRNC